MKVYIVRVNRKFIGVGKNLKEATLIVQQEEALANRYTLASTGYPEKHNWEITEWETGFQSPLVLVPVWEAYVYSNDNQTEVKIIEHLIIKEDLDKLTNKPYWHRPEGSAVSVYSTESPDDAKETGLATWTLDRK